MKENLDAAIKKIKKDARGRVTGFAIGNTSDLFTHGRYYETPLRHTSELIYSGVVVRDVETAEAIARAIDGKIDYVFVDDEKKIRKIYYGKNDIGNIEQEVRKIIKKSTLLTYKGNDLALEAVDALIGNSKLEVGGLTIAVIGMGNLGSKIALRLVERGAYVVGYRRNQKKLTTIVGGINAIKSEYTKAKAFRAKNVASACRHADIVIGATNEKSVITKSMLASASQDAMLIDVGKGCFAEDVADDPARLLYRLDVSILQKYLFSGLIKVHTHFQKKLGRRTIPELGITLISMGLAARKGEVIVDDIEAPSAIIGIAAGGGVLVKNTLTVQKKIEALRVFMRKK